MASDRIEALRSKLAAAEQARDVAASALTEDDRTEIELRKATERADEERLADERAKRDIDLQRREDLAREIHGDDAKLCSVAIDGYSDTFVLMHQSKAFSKWEHDLTAAASNKKLDKAEIARVYAVASVIDWNGITDFGIGNLNGHALIEFLKRQPGIVTPIVNAAARLAGFFAEERKSGG